MDTLDCWSRVKVQGGRDGRGRGWRGGIQTQSGRAHTQNILCRNLKSGGSCRYGPECRYSHDTSGLVGGTTVRQTGPRHFDLTSDQQRLRDDYHAWKRVVKSPPRPSDGRMARQLWNGALEILNGGEREWKQMIARDLDNEDYRGRDHILAVLTITIPDVPHDAFVDMVHPFMKVVTHPALLDCLSVDTSIGSLYNFISGLHGARAIPFFRHLVEALVGTHPGSGAQSTTVHETLVAATTALRELLRREARARFHEDLPILIATLQGAVQTIPDNSQSRVAMTVLGETQAMVSRATGLLGQGECQTGCVLTTKHSSTYPSDLQLPGGRHDNDKADIVEIMIFPTRDEILSEQREYMPSTDLRQPHFLPDSVERHLDTQFRLLRHDTFGELKEVLGRVMYATDSRSPKLSLALGGFRANQYTGAYISYVSFDAHRGLKMNLSFDQPAGIHKKSTLNRQRWWEGCKWLAEGVLLSFVTNQGPETQHLFFVVTERVTAADKVGSLVGSNGRCTISVRLASPIQSEVETAVRLSRKKAEGIIVEFPGVLPATFTPILENLQDMQRLSRLPLRQWILPDNTEESSQGDLVDVPPPRYARQTGFKFSFLPLVKPKSSIVAVDPVLAPNDPSLIDSLERETDLDHGQCQALLAALTREFALIQGPPGTGKTYLGVQLMKIFMHCKNSVDLGPIVVVCYTNHALDQFLEHLLAMGVRKIVRIGGQSRSALLESRNLRDLSRSETKTRSEGYLISEAHRNLERAAILIKRALGKVHGGRKREAWSNMQYHLERYYPRIHQQFRRGDWDGFEHVGRHPFDLWCLGTMDDRVDNFPQGAEAASEQAQIIERAEVDVNSLSHQERRAMMEMWSQQVHDYALDELLEVVKEADRACQAMTKVHDEVDRRVLQHADVIGITTTGLAKRIATLKCVQCKIVICEEAGEVMEPHMLSALLPSIEHFIQIGDHEQLRPQINNYNLSIESREGSLYRLDRSQFERLSVGEAGRLRLPVAQLNVQRRMRPEISTLIRDAIYPRLEDHTDTMNRPDVVGLRHNVFWLDHTHLEENMHNDAQSRSHSNAWEAEMVRALVRHLVRQGAYRSSDIAILTPYTGQLRLLRSIMGTDFEIVLSDRDQEALDQDDVVATIVNSIAPQSGTGPKSVLQKRSLSELLRIATVDNFQGEEAKVVILSLVRSNEEQRVGFLKTTNRINVLLSRAQHGMYLIGNTNTYSNVPMWQKTIEKLRASNSVSSSLELRCPRHTDTAIHVASPDDFLRLSPEGGCRLACDWRLPDCGHSCQARCHSETMHAVFSCPRSCQRLHDPCKHACQQQTCGEPCGKCRIKLHGIELACGHIKDDIFCFQAQEPHQIRCEVVVQKRVPECHHLVEVPCPSDPASEDFRCPTPCAEILPCGHTCPGTCGTCNTQEMADARPPSHQKCRKVCGRRFGTCNHMCHKRCHGDEGCGLCVSPCEVRCQHSKCMLLCHEACAPCVEKCPWSCEHQKSCGMPCSAPCNRLPCDRRCSKRLACGHDCPGVCGEACPEEYCQQCTTKQDARVDLLELKTYANIDVDETPIIVLGCGHFFTAESLDGLVGIDDVYTTDSCGRRVGLADITSALVAKIPQCPDCQCPIRQFVARRYNRLINRAVVDEMTKRFVVSGQTELERLEARIAALQQRLETSRPGVVTSLRLAYSLRSLDTGWVGKKQMTNRYRACQELDRDVASFIEKSADHHQPAQKLYDAIVQARRTTQANSLHETTQNLRIAEPMPPVSFDRRITLGGRLAQVRAQYIAFEDQKTIADGVKYTAAGAEITDSGGKIPPNGMNRFLESCRALIRDCNTARLTKLFVEAALYFARVTRIALQTASFKPKNDLLSEARELLDDSLTRCRRPFQNADLLRAAVEEILRVLSKEKYEPVTPEELAAIKQAMVSGPRGIATHSGHWYNCANGHPFAIGECGMPMERARCPECGAPIGGLNHEVVEGVTRATSMEA